MTNELFVRQIIMNAMYYLLRDLIFKKKQSLIHSIMTPVFST